MVRPFLFAALALTATTPLHAASATLDSLPVVEVTAFKDGHALLVHEGKLDLDENGAVQIGPVPEPVFGSFWAYGDDAAEMRSVLRTQVEKEQGPPVANLVELLKANVGKSVRLTIGSGEQERTHEGRIEAATDQLVILDSDQAGTLALTPGQVQSVSFPGERNLHGADKEKEHALRLRLAAPDDNGALPGSATVGVAYVQKGLRWVPSYRLELDGNGRAVVKMQATLDNQITDLDNATVHLAVGVPRIAFAGERDPLAPPLPPAGPQPHPSTWYEGRRDLALSNAVMSQSMGYGGAPAEAAAAPPSVTGQQDAEDLYFFTVENVTLAKGEAMLLPVTEFELPYEDIFKLTIPVDVPQELAQQYAHRFNNEAASMNRALLGPKAVRVLRLTNDGTIPVTTAPVLVFLKDRFLAQSMTTYAPVGAKLDVELNVAVDIAVDLEQEETARRQLPDTPSWRDTEIDMKGRVRLVNRRGGPVTVEVSRYVLGQARSASGQGTAKTNVLSPWEIPAEAWPPYFQFGWWPTWLHNVNSISRLQWTLELEHGEEAEVEYEWRYWWD